VAVSACKRNRDAASGDTASTATATGTMARDTAAAATAPAAGAPSPSAGTTALAITGGDPEIVQVLATVDKGEVEDGHLGERMAHNSQVKAYARELVTDHSKSLQQDRQLAKALNVPLKLGDSSTSGRTDTTAGAGAASNVAMQLQTIHQQTDERLRSLKGAAFDTAFVDAEAMGHQQVLALLQSAESQAQNPAVKEHLTVAVKGVQTHLDRAQKLQQALTSGSSGMRDSTSKMRTGSDTGRKP
jgi:putative membrane protein